MNTSTLALRKSDYESELGEFMGWGRGSNGGNLAWSADKVIKIQMDVASGLRRFYYCGHPWSFLKQTASLTLAAGETSVKIPNTFAGLDNGTQIMVLDDSGNGIAKLTTVSVNKVQAAFGLGETTGSPQLIALRPNKNVPAGGMQQTEFYVFPEADAEYTLTFQHFFTPDYLLDSKMPYALGGVEHHETILEMCLAVAETRRDNALTVHSLESQRLLRMSIEIDQRRQPVRIGYNGDRSDGPNWNGFRDDWFGDARGGVTVDGTRYT